MATIRSLQDAQHEAAHVVVGVALGLRLYKVTLEEFREGGVVWSGAAIWYTPMAREADLLMSAAGVAWERRVGDIAHAAGDLKNIRARGVRGTARLRALEIGAWAILETRSGIHGRVTRALLEQDLTARDVRALWKR